MTDEKLIEKAAKAIFEKAYPGSDWNAQEPGEKDQHRTEARAALAVFEDQQKPSGHRAIPALRAASSVQGENR